MTKSKEAPAGKPEPSRKAKALRKLADRTASRHDDAAATRAVQAMADEDIARLVAATDALRPPVKRGRRREEHAEILRFAAGAIGRRRILREHEIDFLSKYLRWIAHDLTIKNEAGDYRLGSPGPFIAPTRTRETARERQERIARAILKLWEVSANRVNAELFRRTSLAERLLGDAGRDNVNLLRMDMRAIAKECARTERGGMSPERHPDPRGWPYDHVLGRRRIELSEALKGIAKLRAPRKG